MSLVINTQYPISIPLLLVKMRLYRLFKRNTENEKNQNKEETHIKENNQVKEEIKDTVQVQNVEMNSCYKALINTNAPLYKHYTDKNLIHTLKSKKVINIRGKVIVNGIKWVTVYSNNNFEGGHYLNIYLLFIMR